MYPSYFVLLNILAKEFSRQPNFLTTALLPSANFCKLCDGNVKHIQGVNIFLVVKLFIFYILPKSFSLFFAMNSSQTQIDRYIKGD